MKVPIHILKKRLAFLLLGGIMGLLPLAGSAQWLEPHRIQIGMSGGFGGLHGWGAPSFDVIWNRLTARVSPGLFYLGGGLTYQLTHYNPKRRHDRILILSGYYLNDWLLANSGPGLTRTDQNVYMLMPGIHVNLDHRGTIYFEVSAGAMYVHERLFSKEDRNIRSVGDHFAPMGEVRIGGIFLSRKEHVQQFPLKYKEKPADRVKKRKLKFKD